MLGYIQISLKHVEVMIQNLNPITPSVGPRMIMTGVRPKCGDSQDLIPFGIDGYNANKQSSSMKRMRIRTGNDYAVRQIDTKTTFIEEQLPLFRERSPSQYL